MFAWVIRKSSYSLRRPEMRRSPYGRDGIAIESPRVTNSVDSGSWCKATQPNNQMPGGKYSTLSLSLSLGRYVAMSEVDKAAVLLESQDIFMTGDSSLSDPGR